MFGGGGSPAFRQFIGHFGTGNDCQDIDSTGAQLARCGARLRMGRRWRCRRSQAARRQRLAASSAIVESGVRAYGVNTGVGALADTVVDRAVAEPAVAQHHPQPCLRRRPLLAPREVRAIIAAQIANFAHGHSGVRPRSCAICWPSCEQDCIPDVPSKGSAGYLTHNAHIALVLIGEGSAHLAGKAMSGADALAALGLSPLVLGAKEGLSLVNGTACAAGLSSVAMARAERLLDWTDAVAALTLEAASGQMAAFDESVLALRPSPGIQHVGATPASLSVW
jgi:histidine ammonia-lyase